MKMSEGEWKAGTVGREATIAGPEAAGAKGTDLEGEPRVLRVRCAAPTRSAAGSLGGEAAWSVAV